MMMMMMMMLRKRRSRTATTRMSTTRTIVVSSTVHTKYPWRHNRYSSSIIRERRGRWSVTIIIRTVPIGQYMIHYSHPTSSRVVVTLPSSVYEVIHTNRTPSYYRIINSITQSYVYTWNLSVVNILAGTDEHGHKRDNKLNKEVDNRPSSSSSSNMPTYSNVRTNTIIYNNQACHAMPYHVTIHLP